MLHCVHGERPVELQVAPHSRHAGITLVTFKLDGYKNAAASIGLDDVKGAKFTFEVTTNGGLAWTNLVRSQNLVKLNDKGEGSHQFGTSHTWSGKGSSCSPPNFMAKSAMEIGAGSTLVTYAGICDDDNTQMRSDPYFHVYNLNEFQENYFQSEDESTVEVRLLSDPTDVDSEPRKWKPNTVYTIAIDDGAIIDGAGNQARFNVAPVRA